MKTTKYIITVTSICASCILASCAMNKTEAPHQEEVTSSSHEVTVEGPSYYSGRPLGSDGPNGAVAMPNK